MSEIDLIPTEYRSEVWLRRALKLVGVTCGAIVASTALAAGAFSNRTSNINSQIAELEAHRAVTAQQRSELEALSGRQNEFQQQLELLEGLRSGAAADDMFLTVDRALADHSVWFTRWQFQRAGVLVGEQPGEVYTGYFIVVPEGERDSDEGAWKVETRMLIQGQAIDHAALSRFVDGLFAQPEIVDVRVQKTLLRPYRSTDVVDFDLAIVLNSNLAG